MSDRRWFRIGVAVVLILSILWLLDEVNYVFTPIIIFFKSLFVPFLIAGLLFYLLRPLIILLEKGKMPRKLAILFVFLIICGLITLIVKLIGPIIQEQFQQLIDNIPLMISAVENAITYWQQNQEFIPQYVKDFVNQFTGRLEQIFSATGVFVTEMIGSIFSFVFTIVVVPFILFYLLNDREKFIPSVRRFFPETRRDEIEHVLKDMDRALASYIQGQLIVSTCVGILLLIGYVIIGLDYALLLSLFAMVTNVIPFLGPFIAVIPAVIVAFFQEPIMVLYVIIVMIIAQQIESNFISPQIMGRALNVHPLTIILLIIVGGNLAGILGMILIIPVYAVSKVVIKHTYQLILMKQNRI